MGVMGLTPSLSPQSFVEIEIHMLVALIQQLFSY